MKQDDAESSNPSETCMENVCGHDVQTEPGPIHGEAVAEDRPLHRDEAPVVAVADQPNARPIEATVDRRASHDWLHSEPAEPKTVTHDVPAYGPRQQLPQQQLESTHHGVPLLFGFFLVASLVWQHYKHKRQQKEWRRKSMNQLEMIRQRNLQLVEDQQSSPQSQSSAENVSTSKEKLGEALASKEKEESYTQKESYSDNGKSVCNKMACSEAKSQAISEGNIGNKHETLKSPSPDHISKIRAKQQEQLALKTKVTQQQLKRQKIKKKQILHSNLNHHVADEAYQRRRNVIAEEASSLLQSNTLTAQVPEQPQQTLLNELEEMERIALQEQQNLAYQESLQLDQERERQLAMKNEMRLRREKALANAKERLVTAGVQSDVITSHNNCEIRATDRRSEVKVRLLLPSGQRVEGTFAAEDVIGLVYDLALVVLDGGDFLWSNENGDHNALGVAHIGTPDDDSCETTPSDDGNGYNDILVEWRQIFFPFKVASTFPQRAFDDLSVTLEDCGLNQSAMLMVVVESD